MRAELYLSQSKVEIRQRHVTARNTARYIPRSNVGDTSHRCGMKKKERLTSATDHQSSLWNSSTPRWRTR